MSLGGVWRDAGTGCVQVCHFKRLRHWTQKAQECVDSLIFCHCNFLNLKTMILQSESDFFFHFHTYLVSRNGEFNKKKSVLK